MCFLGQHKDNCSILLVLVRVSILCCPFPFVVFLDNWATFSLLFYAEKLNLKKADEFKYLRQSNCYTISGVDDAEQFRVVKVLFWA